MEAIEAVEFLEQKGYAAEISFDMGPTKVKLKREEKKEEAAPYPRYRRPPVYSSIEEGVEHFTSLCSLLMEEEITKEELFDQCKLWPEQARLIDAMLDPGIPLIFVYGSRRTGKTTSLFLSAIEYLLDVAGKAILMGANADSISAILEEMLEDPLTKPYTDPVIARRLGGEVKRTGFRLATPEKKYLHAKAPTTGQVKGLKGDLIWVEEFDQLLTEKPKVYADLIAVARSEPSMKIIMSANQTGGQFKLMRREFEALDAEGKCATFVFDDDHCPHARISESMGLGSRDEEDSIFYRLMKLAVSEDYADSQLKNTELDTGEVFNAELLSDAYNTYDEWLLSAGIITESLSPRAAPAYSVISVDPGFGHPTGITAWHALRAHCWCSHARKMKGNDSDQDTILSYIADLAIELGAVVILESGQWGSSYWAKELRKRGIKVIMRKFQGRGKPNDRSDHIKYFNGLLGAHRLHIGDLEVYKSLTIYNPELKEKTAEGYKGDLADSSLLAVKWLSEMIARGGRQIVRSSINARNR
jgi:hypothetical protein